MFSSLKYPSEYVKFIISISWACSSWTKAYLMLYNSRSGMPLIFRKKLAEDEKKILACWHMLIVYLLLRWLKFKSLPSPHTTPLPSLVALIPALLWSYLPTFFIEEFIHFFILRHFMRVDDSMRLIIKGRPVLEGTKDDDCCVCYGIGIGDGSSSFYSDQDDVDNLCESTLENYCKVPHHVAHRNCMLKWYTMGNTGFVSRLALQNLNIRLTNANLLRPAPTCPICRGEIIFKVIQKDLLEKEKANEGIWGNKNNWLLKLDSLIKDWRNVMNWRWVAVRVEITVIYILIVWKFLKWREKLMRNLNYYNRT